MNSHPTHFRNGKIPNAFPRLLSDMSGAVNIHAVRATDQNFFGWLLVMEFANACTEDERKQMERDMNEARELAMKRIGGAA